MSNVDAAQANITHGWHPELDNTLGLNAYISRFGGIQGSDGHSAVRSTAWMKLVMYALEPGNIDMGIHLGRRNVGMPQHFLNYP